MKVIGEVINYRLWFCETLLRGLEDNTKCLWDFVFFFYLINWKRKDKMGKIFIIYIRSFYNLGSYKKIKDKNLMGKWVIY